MEEAEKLLGRKLNKMEKFLIENTYDKKLWNLGKDSNGNLILNRKDAPK